METSTQLGEQYSKNYALIVVKAWSDENFRQQLLANPKQVLDENGVKTANGTAVSILVGGTGVEWDREGGRLVLPLPNKPDDISDTALSQAASAQGDVSVGVCCCCCCP